MRMRWFRHLYVGEKAKKNRYSIVQEIMEETYRPGIFVITPASNGNNILDIYPVSELSQSWYRSKEFQILGIAKGYGEALTVAGMIVDEMFQKTGGFCLDDFLRETDNKVW